MRGRDGADHLNLSDRRAKLSESKRALLAKRLEGLWADGYAPVISRGADDEPAPLSFAQQRLWLLDRLHPGKCLYNFCDAVHLYGRSVDVDAIEESLTRIVQRHEPLRTRFRGDAGLPVQVVAPVTPVKLEMHDLRAHPVGDREAVAVQLLRERLRQPFDLAHDQLLRAALLRCAEQHHVLAVTMHHIASDGWSMGLLVSEFAATYRAVTAGSELRLPELAVRYTDFAQWQRQQVADGALDAHLAYWKRQLQGAPPVLELPTDDARPNVRTFRGERQSLLLPKRIEEAVRRLGQEEQASLFMTLLAAFTLLLARYSQQEDIVVGSPVANRQLPELEPLIGFFVNMVVLRTDLSGDPTFRELLSRVRDVALEAYSHQDVPFDRLVDELHPERLLAHSPLFQVAFALQNAPLPTLELPGITVERLDFHDGIAKFDLLMSIVETPDGLLLNLEYNSDLFGHDRMATMLGHYRNVLTSAAARPDDRLSRLDPLSPYERRRVLVDWNDTRGQRPRPLTVHQMFEAQVVRTPGAPAVVFDGHQLSYDELERQANRLAHHLRALGVAPEVRVGVCMERSLGMVVAVLAVLKAGGAYVPLDPAYPEPRLSFMLTDAKVAVVLTQDETACTLAGAAIEQVVIGQERLEAYPDHKPAVAVLPENLSYVLYTSGSTGTPKGVAMRNDASTNLIAWQVSTLVEPRAAPTAQFASLSFDVSFQEMFGTWCSGGTLVLMSEETRKQPDQLLATLAEAGVRRLFLPFVALSQLATAATRTTRLPPLVEVITAGEQLRVTDEILAFCRRAGARLRNQYGPCETHVVTEYVLPTSEAWPGLPPIGRPIANTEIYILDRFMQPVPLGATGEIYIGGDSLARGYLDRPGLTAERFVPDPFGGWPGARLYRTGDMARYRPDGNVEFLGRADHQVKLRGFRIELGEIEAVIRQHAAIGDAVVVLAPRGKSERRLVAYVVPQASPPPTPAELRSFVRSRVPDYMAPTAFVALDALPVNANGKVDRAALPALDVAVRDQRPVTALRSDTEKAIADVWRAVLQLPVIGADENFFDIGGESLSLVQVQERLTSMFGREVSAVELFAHPTIQSLADHFDGDSGELDGATPAGASRRASTATRERLRLRRRSARKGSG